MTKKDSEPLILPDGTQIVISDKVEDADSMESITQYGATNAPSNDKAGEYFRRVVEQSFRAAKNPRGRPRLTEDEIKIQLKMVKQICKYLDNGSTRAQTGAKLSISEDRVKYLLQRYKDHVKKYRRQPG